jgi:AcrR family transcriptional regulator
MLSDIHCQARCFAQATGYSADSLPAETLSAKGRQTRQAIEQAARKLFAERGFHGTTLSDITSAAGKSPASFYRYYSDKEDLLAALAESFLHEIVTPSGLSLNLPDAPDDDAFFTAVVTGYWNMFKQNIGIMIAVAQLAATQPRFAAVQNQFRRFGMDIVAASVRRAQEQGYGDDLNAEHTAAAIALLFENFTTVVVGSSGLGLEIDDADAIATLSRIWKKTLYGF